MEALGSLGAKGDSRVATAAAQEVPSAKSTERFYRPELDILRFVAFGMVFVAHTGWAHALLRVGILGVPVFFFLSAFLITDLLLREQKRIGRVSVRRFYIRRILRIWPLYFAVLLVGFVVVNGIVHHSGMSGRDLAWYLLLVGNWRAATHGYLPLGLGLLWSIGVEEQFYLAWPMLLRWLNRRGVLYAAIAMWFGSQLAVAILCLKSVPFQPGIWCNTFAQLQYFALGAATSVLLNGRLPNLPGLIRIEMAVACLFLFLTSLHLLLVDRPPHIRFVLPSLLLAGVGTELLFFSLFGLKPRRIARPTVYLGKISYGLYVFHLCVWTAAEGLVAYLAPAHGGTFVQYLLAIPITAGLAMFSYHFFEMPFLRLKSRFEIIRSRAI